MYQFILLIPYRWDSNVSVLHTFLRPVIGLAASHEVISISCLLSGYIENGKTPKKPCITTNRMGVVACMSVDVWFCGNVFVGMWSPWGGMFLELFSLGCRNMYG